MFMCCLMEDITALDWAPHREAEDIGPGKFPNNGKLLQLELLLFQQDKRPVGGFVK